MRQADGLAFYRIGARGEKCGIGSAEVPELLSTRDVSSGVAAMTSLPPFHPHERLLMGPGPSPVPARVLRAMSAPTLGHLDPQYVALMDETCELLRRVFRTQNALTFPVSGTGM